MRYQNKFLLCLFYKKIALYEPSRAFSDYESQLKRDSYYILAIISV